MENKAPKEQQSKETMKRSLVKAICYRTLIIALDFITVYLFTGKVEVAVGFMLISNVYTTIIYFLYERVWGKIKWGKEAVAN